MNHKELNRLKSFKRKQTAKIIQKHKIKFKANLLSEILDNGRNDNIELLQEIGVDMTTTNWVILALDWNYNSIMMMYKLWYGFDTEEAIYMACSMNSEEIADYHSKTINDNYILPF